MLTVSIISHGQGAIAQRVLDEISRWSSALQKVIVTRNLPEGWEPVLRHSNAVLQVIDNRVPKGFGANHNQAFAECTTPFFAVLNPDLEFNETDLTSILINFEDPDLALISPQILDPDGNVSDFNRDLMTLPNLVRRRLRLNAQATAWIAGMCFVLRSSSFHSINGFDERFFLYFEDADLCGRLALRGWNWNTDPNFRVTHHARRKSLKSFRHLVIHLSSLCKYWLSPAFWAYRSLLRNDIRRPPEQT